MISLLASMGLLSVLFLLLVNLSLATNIRNLKPHNLLAYLILNIHHKHTPNTKQPRKDSNTPNIPNPLHPARMEVFLKTQTYRNMLGRSTPPYDDRKAATEVPYPCCLPCEDGTVDQEESAGYAFAKRGFCIGVDPSGIV